jgi:hypothetical protein
VCQHDHRRAGAAGAVDVEQGLGDFHLRQFIDRPGVLLAVLEAGGIGESEQQEFPQLVVAHDAAALDPAPDFALVRFEDMLIVDCAHVDLGREARADLQAQASAEVGRIIGRRLAHAMHRDQRDVGHAASPFWSSFERTNRDKSACRSEYS